MGSALKPSWASSPSVRRSMLANGPRDSEAEVLLRRALYRLGLRYRLHVLVPTAARSVRADLVFATARIIVFMDGCFWHVCPRHATWPKQHAHWWRTKLKANVARDRRQAEMLRLEGWLVVRVWAHESPKLAAARIHGAIRRRLRSNGSRRAEPGL